MRTLATILLVLFALPAFANTKQEQRKADLNARMAALKEKQKTDKVAPKKKKAPVLNRYYRPPVKAEYHSHPWPASRVLAHSMFWSGLILVAASVGILAAGVAEFNSLDVPNGGERPWVTDFPFVFQWLPAMLWGGNLFIGGIISGLVYQSDEPFKDAPKPKQSAGLMLKYNFAF